MRTALLIILRRLGLGLLTLFLVTLIIFAALELLPGDVAQTILGQAATPETLAAFRRELGLDRSAPERYVMWLWNAVQGDFGVSMANGRPISGLISERAGNTLFLALYAAAIAVPSALALGILAALYRETLFDKIVSSSTLAVISFPEFFVAYILIVIFAVQLGWFPSLAAVQPGMALGDKLVVTFLPALTLTLVVVAHMMRMTRASLVSLLALPYVEMARLKGMRPLRVIVVHALPNALAPIINVVALNLAYMVVGVVLVETVFVYPGLGQLLVDSVSRRDMTVVQAACLIFAATYILLNLAADILSILSNPRLRHPR